ncbi:hypothetical protein Hypma_004370 [Hypsizygus marmoreus]|uniref:Uncharacterized protein n=1 Tax=Hypsizygus marmoreus TaxID=39966 RepID=A0A369K3E6_HYPMA|nr:hypothetical protein Hypma_004370 [Hypsizygus marmoreus]
MLSNSQNFASSSSNVISGYPSMQPSFGAVQSFPSNSGAFLPDHSLHQGTDPNSPEIFKQNIQVAQEHVARLQNLARRALAGIQNAYHPGNSPAQTEADIATLKQTLQTLTDLFWQTGVGALPLLPLGGPDTPVVPPTEQQMMADANRSIQALYEALKRSQDSAAVVANLLGAPDQSARGGE